MMEGAPEVANNQQSSKEDYLIRRANEALATDIYAAKSWLITAKSLFPQSAKIQFEAYRLEKLSRNMKEAATCFSEIFQNFPDNQEIWKEIDRITTSLRAEQRDENEELLCQMFKHIPEDLQHRLLIMTADHSEDTMEHCKLLLLLLNRFPQTTATHGPRLVETLLTAEKHSHPGVAVNEFRKLLAMEALPLLGSSSVELNPRLSLRLLCKAVEFYFAYIQQPQDPHIAKPWDKLFQVIELIGKKLGWELSSHFATTWNQELYCDRLQQYASAHSGNLCEEPVIRQLLISSIVVLMRILNEHATSFSNDEHSYCLIEAFVQPLLAPEPKVKKRKREEIAIAVTSDNEYSGSGLPLAVKLYDLIHSNEILQRESLKIIQQMRLDAWLNPFLNDLAMYKGMHHDLLLRLPKETNTLSAQLRLASTCFFVKDYKSMIEYIMLIANTLPKLEGKTSNCLTVPAVRHLHYLTLARFPVLQYCCRLLLTAIKDNFSWANANLDLAIGHALVLMQIDWPQEAPFLHILTQKILSRRSFSYPLFQAYVINVDILEELMYLWMDHGGGVVLDVAVNTGILQNRRISTRGADKGVREEVRQTMRRQAARDGVDHLDELLQRFILNEKEALLLSLIIH
ncbi:hypothetical protein QAD02_016546 [Eretmocerus hayati]|uniref:Uncharacterized protein n=1 Tax=Eretmocerus hayati TaxID=131215 RepID=A0ACC2PBT8_9HYME|nr:hypothetical protein QAD02_016546 [Eretmocerus hayati]